MIKILYCILHGSVNKDRYYNVKETWGKNVDCLFYSDYEDLEKNVVKVSDKNDYSSNEEKHINAIKYINGNLPIYDWYFFCDDDTYVNVKKIQSKLIELDSEYIYGATLKCWPKDPNLEYLSGGAGYLISNQTLRFLSENVTVLNTGYSDVTLGHFIKKLNIKMNNDTKFKSQSPHIENVSESELSEYFTFHYIKTKDAMEGIHRNII